MSKRRDVNFTREETDKLMELVQQYLDIILNNKCTSDVNKQKEDAWNLIAEEFNSFTTNHRTAKQLKHKLENLKRRNELRELQQQMQSGKLNTEGEGEGDEHSRWLRRLQEGKGGGDWEDSDDWGGRDAEEANTKEVPPHKKLKIQTIYVKPLPTLHCGREEPQPPKAREREADRERDSRVVYSAAQVAELFRLEVRHKQERHAQQMEYDRKLQEAQLNKLALEARIYEAQLSRTNLEVRQLSRRLEREEEVHGVRMRREGERSSAEPASVKESFT